MTYMALSYMAIPGGWIARIKAWCVLKAGPGLQVEVLSG
jgi:hypothetical protein